MSITGKLPLTLLLMMVIVSAGSLVPLQPVSATFPGVNGKIVFDRNIGTTAPQNEIFTVNPDGSGLTQLTFTGLNEAPRWSADGTKIVFESERTGPEVAIWMMNADGSGQTQITHPPASTSNYDPAFSPDGSKIVFQNSSPTYDIWVTNVDGTNQKQLTTGPNLDYTPVWSPDGSKIAFARRPAVGNIHIFVMNPDGSGQTDITQVEAPTQDDGTPEWSPDGRMIAFANGPSGSIWVMNADGSGRKHLSIPPAGAVLDEFPAWSPDGTKIAFARSVITGSIIVMNAADGSNPVDITHLQAHSDTDENPNWQPLSLPPPPPPTPPLARPVGGVVLSTNKLEILTPYLALAGLVIAVSAVVVVRKRRD